MPSARVEPAEPEGDDASALVSRAELKQLVEANKQLMARVEQLEQSSMKAAAKAEEQEPESAPPLMCDNSVRAGALWAGAAKTPAAEVDCHGRDNIYGFCYEDILNPKSSMRSIVVAFVYLLTLSLMQLLLAFGSLDAARLLHTQSKFAAYKPPLDNAFFYPDTLVKDGNTTTSLNLFVSLVCITMLVLVFKTDNESILLTVCPLEELLLPGDDQPKSVLRRVGLVCRCVLLQLFWAVRLFMAPMCLMSSAYIFADADTALDNVMNAVAVGFIVELDDTLYAQFLTTHDQTTYESHQASSPRGSFAQVVKGGAQVVSVCTASVCILDFTLCLMGYLCVTELWDQCSTGEAAYLSGMLSTDVFANRFLHYESFIIYVLLRAVVFAVGEAVIGYLARRNVAKAQGQTPRLIATLVVYAILIIGSAMLLWSFTYTLLERFFGLRRTLFNEPEINACLQKKTYVGKAIYSCGHAYPAMYDEDQCLTLHELSMDQLIAFQVLFNGSLVYPDTLLERYDAAIDANFAKPGCFAEILAMTWGSYPEVSVCGGNDFCDDGVPVYSYSYGAQ